jgi:hypothetical protein
MTHAGDPITRGSREIDAAMASDHVTAVSIQSPATIP